MHPVLRLISSSSVDGGQKLLVLGLPVARVTAISRSISRLQSLGFGELEFQALDNVVFVESLLAIMLSLLR